MRSRSDTPAFDVRDLAFNGTFWTATVIADEQTVDVTNEHGSWSTVPFDEIGTRKELLPFVSARLAAMTRSQQKAYEAAAQSAADSE